MNPLPHIIIDVTAQELVLVDSQGNSNAYPVSTSSRGTGCETGSFKTPLGRFRIAEKIGGNCPIGTIFRSRIPIGIWPDRLPDDCAPEADLVLTRILWLDGLDEQNANTYARYIYIHGTNWEEKLGSPVSCGCIRMSNAGIIDLFDQVDVDTLVTITT